MPRDKLIQVRVDEQERERIRKRAGAAGMEPSAYLRALGLGEFNGAGSHRPKEEVAGDAKTATSTEANGETREEFIERRAAQLHRRFPLPAARRVAAEEWDGQR